MTSLFDDLGLPTPDPVPEPGPRRTDPARRVVHRTARRASSSTAREVGVPPAGCGADGGGMTTHITLRGPGDVVAALPYQLGYHLLRTNDGVTMRPWACPVGREGGLRVV